MGMAHSDRDMAGLHVLSQSGSWDWLNVVPSTSLSLHLTSQYFILAAQYSLGCNVFPISRGLPCQLLYEGYGPVWHPHIMTVFRTLYNIASQAGLGPRREEHEVLSGSARRPGDIHLPHWFGGLDTALDLTVVTRVQGSLTARAVRAPGVAAKEAHHDKLAKSYE